MTTNTKPRSPLLKIILTAAGLAIMVIMAWLFSGTDAAFKLLGFIFTGVFITGVIKTAISFHKWRELQLRTLYITAATAPLALFIYIMLLPTGTGLLFYLLLTAGSAGGLSWGLTTRLQTEKGTVYSRGTMWGFLIWAGLVVSLQLTNLLFNISPGPLVLLLALQTGVMAIYNLSLALRCQKSIAAR